LVKEYLNTLKKAGNYSWADIANLSGIPEATVRKVFSGETADPRFETIAKLVIAMGGDMNDAMDNKKKKEIEISSTITLKESCEMRLEDQKEYIASLKNDKKILGIAVSILVGVVVLLLVLDIILASNGWIQY
jgi:transcriptional regulator with XRE-family HTH domain